MALIAIASSACGEEVVGSAGCALLPGDLVISEVLANADGSDDGNEWIEVFNATSREQSLSGLELSVAGSGAAKLHRVTGKLSVAAGAYLVLGDGPAGTFPVDYSYGNSLALRDDGAVIGIACGDVQLDVMTYGDRGGAPMKVGRSLSFDGSTAPDAMLNDRADGWCSDAPTYDGTNHGTPGEPNPACGVFACDDNGASRELVQPAPGDLVVTEVFANPSGADAGKEWLELFVSSAHGVDLNGLVVMHQNLSTASTREFAVASSNCVRAQAGSYVVLAASSDRSVNGNVVATAEVADLDLYNAASTAVILMLGDVVIDQAVLPSLSAEGASVSLGGSPTAGANDQAAAFCDGTRSGVFSGSGTPGLANDVCGAVTPNDVCVAGGVGRALVRPTVGSLVVTEVYAAAPGTDTGKEWLELYVAGSTPVDLNGVVVREVAAASGTVRTATVASAECQRVQPGSRVLLAASSDASANGGLPSPVVVATGLSLFDDEATLSIVLPDGTTVDTATLPASNDGVALGLAPSALAAADNDLATAFCAQTASGSFTGQGTPGAVNGVCSPTSSGATCSDGASTRAVVQAVAGDLVISEVFPDPVGSDNFRDWFELYVHAAAAVDLNGLVVVNTASGTRRWTVQSTECLSVAPGAFVVIGGPNVSSEGIVPRATLGGSDASILYNSTSGASLSLLNGDVVVDTVSYDAPGAGKSRQLTSAALDAAANDAALNWCTATASFGAGFGTPGAASTCP